MWRCTNASFGDSEDQEFILGSAKLDGMRYILSIAALFVFLPVAALANVKYYRFSVDTWGPGLPVYTGRVQSRTASGKSMKSEYSLFGIASEF